MTRLFVNVDVDDLELAVRFYTSVFSLEVGRRLTEDGDDVGVIELVGAGVPLYLLLNEAGSAPFPGAEERRSYERHWTPVHLDFVVDDIVSTRERALAAGATAEGPITDHAWGKMALLADPFGHGVCLLTLEGRGYDAMSVSS